MKNTFVTVNFNNAEETIKYIQSIMELENPFNQVVNIIVIDNNSSSEDFKRLEGHISRITSENCLVNLYRNDNNVGYFAGLNSGIRKASKDQDFLIIGNNDVTFERDFLITLNKLNFETKDIVICPDIVNKDGKHENPQLAGRATKAMKLAFRVYFTSYFLSILVYNFSKLLKKLNLRGVNTSFAKRQYIYQGSGACYILIPAFFSHYEGLDDRVFLWGEERLLANQVLKANCRTLYDPSLKIRHNDSMSTSKVPSREAWRINKKSYMIYKNYM